MNIGEQGLITNPLYAENDQGSTSSSNSTRTAGRPGYYGAIYACFSRLSRLLHPRRQGSLVRELRGLVQIQREQANDLCSIARNSDQLAALCVLQRLPTAPLPPRPGSPIWTFERLGNMWPDLARQFWAGRLPSREQSLAETIRSSLRARRGSFASNSSGDAIAPSAPAAFAAAFGSPGNNVRGSHVSAPAVLYQTHAEPGLAASHSLEDGDNDSSDVFFTPKQSFSEDRDDASGDELTEGPFPTPNADGAVAAPSADNATHIRIYEERVVDEAFPGVRLRIRVGPRHTIGNNSTPFYDALPRLLSYCQRSRHDLTQLHITIEQDRVISQRDGLGVDPLFTILSSIRDYLPYIMALQVKYACDRRHEERPSRLAAQRLARAFTKLDRLRIEGNTSCLCLVLFPLSRLRQLEIATDISDGDLEAVLRSCKVLNFLSVRSGGSASDELQDGRGQSAGSAHAVGFPSVMHFEGDHFGLELLRSIPTQVDLRLSVTKGCPKISDIEQIVESRNELVRNRPHGISHRWLFRVLQQDSL
ncbi:uncharacterized protein SCHCODRAFT_02594028 [Schizophyllum commune H4-8]|nr:uncharacterized protein SCHCODRAFT_02594028 [Schizophyllum commune H4-8]KAI5885426.1 hypothetical protein SCHCODRAFT_02594028 [Schizophyllum commune H4-8]